MTDHPQRGRKRAWGKRKVPGAMNNLEADYAALLEARKREGTVLWYRYEAAKWRLTDRDSLTNYVSDFLVQLSTGEIIVVEVKGGFFPEKNRLKLKLLVDQYPFRVVLARRPRKADPWTEEDC